MSKYLYMVNPRIPLKLNGETIRRSKNMELEKEEVQFALKHGPVYRKFTAQVMERVTLQNIDKLHVATKADSVKVEAKDKVVEQPEEKEVDTVQDAVTSIQGQEITEEVTITDGQELIPDQIKPEEETVTNTEEVSELVENNEEVNNESVEETTEVEQPEVETTEETEVSTKEVEPEVETTVETTPVQHQDNNNHYRRKKKNRY